MCLVWHFWISCTLCRKKRCINEYWIHTSKVFTCSWKICSTFCPLILKIYFQTPFFWCEVPKISMSFPTYCRLITRIDSNQWKRYILPNKTVMLWWYKLTRLEVAKSQNYVWSKEMIAHLKILTNWEKEQVLSSIFLLICFLLVLLLLLLHLISFIF